MRKTLFAIWGVAILVLAVGYFAPKFLNPVTPTEAEAAPVQEIAMDVNTVSTVEEGTSALDSLSLPEADTVEKVETVEDTEFTELARKDFDWTSVDLANISYG